LPEGEGENGNQGQSGEEGTQPPSPVTGSGNDPKASEAKTFTEEQLDRIVGKRAREAETKAKQAAEIAIADQLGVTVEEAKKIIEASKQAEEAQKSEIDKLREQNESIKKESDSKFADAQREHHIDRAKLCLTRSGIALPEDEEAAEKALNRVVGLVSVPVGASVDEIKENITELKSEFESLFTQPEKKEEPQPGNVGSHPSGAPRKPVLNNESCSDLSARLAKENNAKRVLPRLPESANIGTPASQTGRGHSGRSNRGEAVRAGKPGSVTAHFGEITSAWPLRRRCLPPTRICRGLRASMAPTP
jgi:hypothetical protein